jgi:hypothetical protein
MRYYVKHHPIYRHDSVVSDKIAFDLLQLFDQIGKGEVSPLHFSHIINVT